MRQLLINKPEGAGFFPYLSTLEDFSKIMIKMEMDPIDITDEQNFNPFEWEGMPIVLFDKSNSKKIVVKCDDYNADDYPTAYFEPIGIVVIPKSHTTTIYNPSDEAYGKNVMMSLNAMNYSSPDDGGDNQKIYWGCTGDIRELNNYDKYYQIQNSSMIEVPIITTSQLFMPSDKFSISYESLAVPGLFHYKTSYGSGPYILDNGILKPNPAYYEVIDDTQYVASTDFKGRSNTNIILSKITVADWQTSSTIVNSYSVGNYPAAACCWRYSTAGTAQGDWYLPAAGELGYIWPFFMKINATLSKINSIIPNLAVLLATSDYYWSSSESSRFIAVVLAMYGGNFFGLNKTSGNGYYVRALAVV